MAELPRGTVTMLFTDIEGSTRLLQELGEETYVRALEDHRRLELAAARVKASTRPSGSRWLSSALRRSLLRHDRGRLAASLSRRFESLTRAYQRKPAA